MNLEDLRDQLLERLREIWAKIQESDTFIMLRERFETLPPQYQKLTTGLGIFLVVYFFYSIPASYMSASTDYEETFQENRDLTRDMIRAASMASSIVMPPKPPSGPMLISEVNNVIKKQRVLDSQNKATQQKDGVADKSLVSPDINQEGVVAKLSQLNLNQLVYVGEDLDNMPGVKLINMYVQADANDKSYFNVDYELAALSVELAESSRDSDDEDDGKSKKKKSKKSKKSRKDDE